MIVIIVADCAIGALDVAELGLLAYLLRRDRSLLWRPGEAVPDVPEDAG